MDPVYLVVSTQTVPLDLNITLQLRDDPILKPTLSTPIIGLNSISIPYNTWPQYNPQITSLRVRYRRKGTSTWNTLDYSPGLGTGTLINLLQGATYEFQIFSRTQLTPTDRTSPLQELTLTTDFLITIQQVRDTEGNPVSGAVVVALPQQDVITKIPASDYGSDLPLSQFAYARANKTNSQGACNIRIPGGHGKVFLLVVPPTTGKSGATVAGLETEEP